MIQDKNLNKTFSIVLIGAGNVATHLGKALEKSGNKILQVYSYTNQSARVLANKINADFTCNLNELNLNADIYIVSVKDDAVYSIISQIKLKKAIIFHTSGSLPLSVFEAHFKHFGVFYPLQTFSKSKKLDFNKVPICIEANTPETLKVLRILGEQVSKQVISIDSNQRKKLHLAAVFACNFSNYMYAVADDILNENNMSLDILKPLIIETAQKIKENSPRKMQTGPAIRNDVNVMETHLKLLENHPEYQSVYALLSKLISKDFL